MQRPIRCLWDSQRLGMIERAHCCFLATNIIERHNLFRRILSTVLMMFSRFLVVLQCQVFSYQNGHHFACKGLRASKFAAVQMPRKKGTNNLFYLYMLFLSNRTRVALMGCFGENTSTMHAIVCIYQVLPEVLLKRTLQALLRLLY